LRIGADDALVGMATNRTRGRCVRDMKHIFLFLALGATCAAPALAEEKEDIRVRVGLGAQVRPDFVGSRERELAPLVNVSIARGDKPFQIEAPDDTFALRLLSTGKLTLGPAANLEPSRSAAKVGAPVDRVDTTLEVGAFAEYLLSSSLRLRGELLKGVNGHEGLVGSVGVDRIWRDGDRYAVTLGPRLLLSDGRYSRAYFGVEPQVAAATALPVFRPKGGIHGVALTGGASVQFGPRWGAFGYARAERLVGDAGKSPIVRTFGSRNQLSAGLGLSYSFRISR
jgi:outer membrane protein